jgi:hypothetical protein
MMEAVRTSETSVDNYFTRQYNPEDNSEQFYTHFSSALMMEAVRTSETSVDNYFTRQYNPEDNSEHHTRRRENFKSHVCKITDSIELHISGENSMSLFELGDVLPDFIRA